MQAAHLTWRELETTAPHWMHEELFTILSVVGFWLDAELEGEEDYESQRVVYAQPRSFQHLDKQLSLFTAAEVSRQTGIPASQIRDARSKGRMSKRLEGRYLRGVLGRK